MPTLGEIFKPMMDRQNQRLAGCASCPRAVRQSDGKRFPVCFLARQGLVSPGSEDCKHHRNGD